MPETSPGEATLHKLLSSHSRWLRGLGLLDKPWLILGSAPSPTIPASLAATHLRIDINNAGRTAAELGLGRAALTLRAKHKSWQEHPKLDTGALLWIHDYPVLLLKLLLLFRPHTYIGSLATMTREERQAVVTQVSGASLASIGDWGKVTNGVAAICYGLLLGVPEIVVAGLSLSKAGHSYDHLARERRQMQEDAFVLNRLKDHPRLLTTEADLANDSGLRLWTGT